MGKAAARSKYELMAGTHGNVLWQSRNDTTHDNYREASAADNIARDSQKKKNNQKKRLFNQH